MGVMVDPMGGWESIIGNFGESQKAWKGEADQEILERLRGDSAPRAKNTLELWSNDQETQSVPRSRQADINEKQVKRKSRKPQNGKWDERRVREWAVGMINEGVRCEPKKKIPSGWQSKVEKRDGQWPGREPMGNGWGRRLLHRGAEESSAWYCRQGAGGQESTE